MTVKRRGHGEGSLANKPRKDGRWEARLLLEDGTRLRIYGKTRAEAKDKLKKAIHDKQDGTLASGPSRPIHQYLKHWLENVAKPSIKPSTYHSYELSIRRMVPYIGKHRLPALKPAHIQTCYSALLEKGLSKRSVELAHAVLHHALKQAVRTGELGRNPCDAVVSPRPDRREMQTLSTTQVQRLFDTSGGDNDHALWVLLATSALRLGEACGLKWSDIDFDGGRLVVRRSLQRQQGTGLVFVEPKTERSRRTVYLAKVTVDTLREHRHKQLIDRLKSGIPYEDNDLVFCNPQGTPLSPSQVDKAFHRALQHAQLPKIRLHDLRHTAASLLLEKGTHPKLVQELLGHSTITLTLNTYSHVVPSLGKEVANQMDSLFDRKPVVR